MNKQADERYELKSGDNPAILDRRFGFRPGTVASLNPGLDYRRLQIGQKLNMPAGWRSGKPTAVTNRVTVGRPQLPKRQAPAIHNPTKQNTLAGFIGPSDDNAYWAMMHESVNGRYLEGDVRNGYPHSRGILQIREVFPQERQKYEKSRAGKGMTYSMNIDDVNDYYGTNFTLKDRDDPVKAMKIYKMYLTRYGRNFYRQHGRNPTDEEYWRMWNGGPGWYRRQGSIKATDDYVRKINKLKKEYIRRGLKPGILWNPATNKYDIDIRTLK